jgi:hypothetical protein
MRRRIAQIAGLATAAAVALIATTAAIAGRPFDTHWLDGLHQTSDFELGAKPAQGGFVRIEVDSNESGDTGAWELIVRNHAGAVIYDGPCVSGREDGREDANGLVLGSNIRLYGARMATFAINDCVSGYHITEVRIIGIRSYLVGLRFT